MYKEEVQDIYLRSEKISPGMAKRSNEMESVRR